MANAALLLVPLLPVPEAIPDGVLVRFSPGEEAPRHVALGPLIGYRDTKWKALRRAEGMGFLAASAKEDGFNFGEFSSDELGQLHRIVHACGGDAVALWTYGQSVHFWSARSAAPRTAPRVLQASLRIAAPTDGGRPGGLAGRIARWLEDTALAPDRAALEQALASPRLTVPAWFASFGVPGAKDVEPPDLAAAWTAFEHAADPLLRGEAPDAAARKDVNALIDEEACRLPAKPAARRGAAATRVAAAFQVLVEALGEPRPARLAACLQAAGLYDPITSGPAGDRLLQTMDKPLAIALALGRLLAHYPVAVRRDPLFFALASHEAEVWNGHGFVEPLARLAERAAATGFTVALVPADREEAFRAAHFTRCDESAARDGWAGEAAIDAGVDTVAAFAKWFAKAKADGAILRCEADGACRLLRIAAGQVVEDAPASDPALVQAARSLDPRAAILAAGFPDVLAPGELAPAPVEAPEGDEEPCVARTELSRQLESGIGVPVTTVSEHHWPSGDERYALLARVRTRDEAWLSAIARDLRLSRWKVTTRWSVQDRGSELWVHSGDSTRNLRLAAQALGDLPPGSTLAVAVAGQPTLLRID